MTGIPHDNLPQRVPMYDTGIAFGGGGARGFAHIGVLHAFEKFGVRPGVLSGVSAGAIAAAMYGSGMSPSDMFQAFSEYGRLSDFTEWTLPKVSIFKLDRFAKILESWLPYKYLEELPMHTHICATDMDNGRPQCWDSGEIVPRVLASCSIPIVFCPVRIDGINYTDGGVLRNLPAWAIRDKCRILIGSNVSPLQQNTEYRKSLLGVALRTFYLMCRANTYEDIRLCDWVVESNSSMHFKTFEVSSMKKIMTHGYECASRMLESLFESSPDALPQNDNNALWTRN